MRSAFRSPDSSESRTLLIDHMTSISVNLISKLATGTDSDVVLIHDSPAHCGLALFRHFLQRAASHVVYVSFDRTPAQVDKFSDPIQASFSKYQYIASSFYFSPFNIISHCFTDPAF